MGLFDAERGGEELNDFFFSDCALHGIWPLGWWGGLGLYLVVILYFAVCCSGFWGLGYVFFCHFGKARTTVVVLWKPDISPTSRAISP